ncbi:hypothetical protein OH77DRAFT_1136662 [Trametes cingulata]|nr:hypothetical protein OH77DRAFT_1136662 [Trametes cingulata]
MRSPVIAFSIIAAAVSPTLVSGAPASPKLDNAIAHTENAATHGIRSAPMSALGTTDTSSLGAIPGLPSAPSPPSGNSAHDLDTSPVERTRAMKKAQNQAQNPVKAASMPPASAQKSRRASDQYTAGGNAYSGAASDSSGGDVQNDAEEGTLTNADGSSK